MAKAKRLALFNHKGGVGKTTLTVNIAGGLVDAGRRVLIVDADPQCNVSAFFLPEAQLDQLLGESTETDTARTLWSAIKPVVEGVGDVLTIEPIERADNLFLAPGDVLLSLYEEELPAAWTDSFARKPRGYTVVGALSRAVSRMCEAHDIDIVLYDVGPNVGALNRSVLLDCDAFITPVAPDLFSLRALTSVGAAVAKWIKDWQTIQMLAPESQRNQLLHGHPAYLGYLVSAFKAYGGSKASSHLFWESRIAPRVKSRVVDVLGKERDIHVVKPPYKLAEVKHYQSLATEAQNIGLPLGWLRSHVNSGYNPEIASAQEQFLSIAQSVLRRLADASI
ncbi:MAG: ParA family protein [Myxococcota bacterium]